MSDIVERLRRHLDNLWDEAADEIERLEVDNANLLERIAELYRAEKGKILSARSTEHGIDTLRADNERLRKELAEAWKDATRAWAICASVHQEWAKGKDAVFKTRQGDFVRHEDEARKHMLACEQKAE